MKTLTQKLGALRQRGANYKTNSKESFAMKAKNYNRSHGQTGSVTCHTAYINGYLKSALQLLLMLLLSMALISTTLASCNNPTYLI